MRSAMIPWLPPDRVNEADGEAAGTELSLLKVVPNADLRGKGAAGVDAAAARAVLHQSKAFSARYAPVFRPGEDEKSGADGLAA